MAAIILFLLLLSIITSTSAIPINTPKSFSAKLIHRDSPDSPFYNPTATLANRRRSAHQRSLQRYNYLRHRATKSSSSITPQAQSDIYPITGDYMMQLNLGTPPMTMMAIIDTGSELTWFQCEPCDTCFPQNLPIFDPSRSSTYKTISCDSENCNKFHARACEQNICIYTIEYADESTSEGYIATDYFGVASSKDSEKISIPDILFGCSYTAMGNFRENITGIIGLDMRPLSFISQLGDTLDWRFSYCFGRATHTDSSSLIVFGDDAAMFGTPTPMVKQDGPEAVTSIYYLNLLDISVGEDRLYVPQGTFSLSSEGGGGVIIDSGTEMTFLHPDAYELLAWKVYEKMTLMPWNAKSGETQRCYMGNAEHLEDGVTVPVITLHFQGGLDVELQPWHTFRVQNAEAICLTLLPSHDMANISIIGNLAQQNMFVGYAIKERLVYIFPGNCDAS
ncbi:Aspartic proteinase CDR1 [Acorus gramineus]|uniref:Aspartic proteinase CDR1 n=1 Tax=Acorus gramineus TaxID=55184 RepID=A0AAV9A860_ACOGR|nr:Aspartic proteinase CDR1 [Acorus gramineus]